MDSNLRLDDLDLAFFEKELRAVDTRAFEEKLPGLKARQLIPTIGGISEGDTSYEYHMFKFIGRAKYASRAGTTDAPRAEVTGAKQVQKIEPLIDGYGYDIWEIAAASKAGRPLDSMRAVAARRALEQLVDESWAWGADDLGIKGLLTLTSTERFDFAGSGAWGDLDTADPAKVVADIMGIASYVQEQTLGVFDRFRVLLPDDAYNVASQLRMGDGSDVTALKFALANSPYIEGVYPWYRCYGSGKLAGSPLSKDLMVAYPYDEMVCGGIARDVNFLAAQPKGFRYEVPAHAATGGVVARYKAIAYCDDIT